MASLFIKTSKAMSESQQKDEVLETINKEGVSIIIGARDEFPQIGMTMCNLMEDCRNSGIEKFEIIMMDNGSEDETSRFWAWKVSDKAGNRASSQRWDYQYSPRGMVSTGRLRIFFDPVLSNVGTRNKGARKARYENIIFSDAHIIVRSGTVRSMVETLIKNHGVIHSPIAWMGADSSNPQPGYQYSYKVGEKIWGTWNKVKVADTPFYIPFCGHAFIAVRRAQFLKYGGYPEAQRVYGGGEPYLDTKYWMLGSTSMMDPNSLIYHLSSGRGYNWRNVDLIHNMFLVSYILGGDEWADRILITYLNKYPGAEAFYRMLYDEAVTAGKADKDWLDGHKKFTFEQVLGLDHDEQIAGMSKEQLSALDETWWCKKCTKRGYPDPHIMRPWDYRNDKLHKTHRSFVSVFRLEDRDGVPHIGDTPIITEAAANLARKYL